MSARAIENWLTNASEKSYQTAFCHLLNAMGYAVIHSTTHGPGEEGKDVIAEDSKGKIYAFQLKQGKINVPNWRKIRGEIIELVENPIRHPSVRRPGIHYSTLVTNDYINESVKSLINGMNDNWRMRKYKPLETWVGSELLMKFIKHTGSFLPQPIPEFHRLLGLMISDGKGTLNKSEFDLLLRSILPLSGSPYRISINQAKRAITASAVIVEYALAGFDREGNHFGKIEAYTMLFCYIRALAIRRRLPEKVWRPTVRILENAVDDCAWQIVQDKQSLGGFGQISPFTEPVVAPYRRTLLSGILAAHGLWCMLGGKSAWYCNEADKALINAVIACTKKAALPSEAFVPAAFLASEFLRQKGHIKLGNEVFLSVLRNCVLRKQNRKDIRPLWGPYLTFEEAILRDLGKEDDILVPERWQYNSSTAYPLILIAACRLLRQDLESLWYPITSLHLNELVPERQYQRLFWDNKKGVLVQRMVHRPQSWGKLCNEARKRARLPNAFKGMKHWLPYYLLVYPHRFNPGPVLALNNAISIAARG